MSSAPDILQHHGTHFSQENTSNPPHIKITTNRSRIMRFNRTCYGRYENTNADRRADDTRSVSIIMALHRRRAPTVDFPPSLTRRVCYISVLDSRRHPHLSTNSHGYSAPSAALVSQMMPISQRVVTTSDIESSLTTIHLQPS